ncbi:TPA: hypothetical protein U0K45_000627 [Streptococcus suis]|nr:hypothetical protein [Streptococcus suis]
MTENIKAALEYAVELNQHGLEIVTAGDVHGIENIKDPKLKERLATVVQEIADKLKG